jgi:anti-sigma-K factor RskA
VAPHLKEYQLLFGYFTESKSEKHTKTIQLKTQKKNWKWLSVAASVALLFSLYGGYEYDQNTKKEAAEVAFQDTQMAFQLLSKNLNKGANAIGYLERYETTKNKIFKSN